MKKGLKFVVYVLIFVLLLGNNSAVIFAEGLRENVRLEDVQAEHADNILLDNSQSEIVEEESAVSEEDAQ